ncbi:MAG: 50S ribosomal protein L27 [Holosporales bacterium]|jgi:large subunit ribosomal protein L27|nr:50S ribosomal protein L27 [Holosporales bacterium]
MATKKAGGSSRNGRDSSGRRLGVKRYGGQIVSAGSIIIRQRGTKYGISDNVGLGKDHTVYSTIDGIVFFKRGRGNRTVVGVLPKLCKSEV